MSKFVILAALITLIRGDEVFKTLSKNPYAAVQGIGSHKRLTQSSQDTTISDKPEEWEEPEVGCDVDLFKKGNEVSVYNLTYGLIQGLYSTE